PRPSPRRVFPLGLRREPVPLTRVDTLRAEGEALAGEVDAHRPAAPLELEAGGEPLLLRAPVGVGGCFVPAEVTHRAVRLVATVGSAIRETLRNGVPRLLPFCDRDLVLSDEEGARERHLDERLVGVDAGRILFGIAPHQEAARRDPAHAVLAIRDDGDMSRVGAVGGEGRRLMAFAEAPAIRRHRGRTARSVDAAISPTTGGDLSLPAGRQALRRRRLIARYAGAPSTAHEEERDEEASHGAPLTLRFSSIP